MKSQLKKIGILGGMGPAASAACYSQMIRYSQTHYHCVQDKDFPQIFIHSLTLDGFDETGILDADLVRSQLIEGARKLASLVDFIVMPCNTVHLFHQVIQESVNVPILSLIDLTVQRVAQEVCASIGLLCSQSTQQFRLYESPFHRVGINVVYPCASEQRQINAIIERVMGGRHTVHDDYVLHAIAKGLQKKGADGIVIGCTELPFAMSSMLCLPIYDTARILAESAIDVTFGQLNF